jgi:hypothetical protein
LFPLALQHRFGGVVPNSSVGECSPHQANDCGHADPREQIFDTAAVVRILWHGVAFSRRRLDLLGERGVDWVPNQANHPALAFSA